MNFMESSRQSHVKESVIKLKRRKGESRVRGTSPILNMPALHI
jgi:hypothetical protein